MACNIALALMQVVQFNEKVCPDDLEGANLCVTAELQRIEVTLVIRFLNQVKVHVHTYVGVFGGTQMGVFLLIQGVVLHHWGVIFTQVFTQMRLIFTFVSNA